MLDPSSIEDAYRRHGPSVLRRARRILDDDQEAAEVVQDVFTSLLDRPEQFLAKSALSTWLYSATTHRSLNRLRDQRTRARLIEENLDRIGPTSASPNPERRAMAQQILARLPDELAQVAVYYYLDELTQAEIASILACSRRHVGDLIARLNHQSEAQEVLP